MFISFHYPLLVWALQTRLQSVLRNLLHYYNMFFYSSCLKIDWRMLGIKFETKTVMDKTNKFLWITHKTPGRFG